MWRRGSQTRLPPIPQKRAGAVDRMTLTFANATSSSARSSITGRSPFGVRARHTCVGTTLLAEIALRGCKRAHRERTGGTLGVQPTRKSMNGRASVATCQQSDSRTAEPPPLRTSNIDRQPSRPWPVLIVSDHRRRSEVAEQPPRLCQSRCTRLSSNEPARVPQIGGVEALGEAGEQVGQPGACLPALRPAAADASQARRGTELQRERSLAAGTLDGRMEQRFRSRARVGRRDVGAAGLGEHQLGAEPVDLRFAVAFTGRGDQCPGSLDQLPRLGEAAGARRGKRQRRPVELRESRPSSTAPPREPTGIDRCPAGAPKRDAWRRHSTSAAGYWSATA